MADGITWGAPAADSSGAGSSDITWGGASSQSPQTDYSPSGFASQYSDAIQNAADKLNVPASAIAGQWGLETAWGKSVIPGTNNLGNIKSTAATGAGVSAKDNATGSTDAYQQFDNPMDFSNAYVNLIQKQYPKAVGAKDPTSFATALKQGGYAQDGNYVNKVSSAANMATKALGALSGSNSANAATQDAAPTSSVQDFVKQAGSAPASPTDTSVSSGAPSVEDFVKQNGTPSGNDLGSTLGNIWNTVKNLPHEIGAGVSQSVQHPLDAAKGAAASIWNPLVNGLSGAAVTEASQAPNNNINVTSKTLADQAAYNKSQNITPDANTNQTAYNAGHFLGNTAAAAAVGAFAPEFEGASLAGRIAAPFINGSVQGGIQGGVSSALDGDSLNDIAHNAGYGAVGGAVLGPVGSAAGAVAKPLIAKALGTKAALAAADDAATQAGAATGGAFDDAEKGMAGKVAQAVNADASPQDAAALAAQMKANANSAVPGYQRTAAETTDNPTIQAIQQGLDKSDNNAGLASRANANADANTDFMRQGATSDADVQAMRDSFQQSQDATAAQGNAEMPPVSAADAAPTGLFGQPAMQRTLGRANVIAQDDGNNAIQQAFDSPNNALVNHWDNNISGDAAKTANFERDRTFQTSPMYETALNNAPPIAVDRQIADLLNTPAVENALRNVERYKLNAQDDTPVLRDLPALSPDGQTYARSIHPQDLNLAKMYLDDHIQAMGNPQNIASADKWMRGTYINLRNNINDVLERRVPGFREANAEYARQSDQMAESEFLTHPNMVDATGKLNVRQLDSTIKAIEAGKANTNPNDPAKLVSTAKLSQLRQMRDDAVALMNHKHAAGVQGDAFNYMRQAAERDPVAAQALQQHLEANSPAYRQFYADQQAGTQAITHQENYNDLLKRADTRTDGNVAWHDVRNLGTQVNDFSPENVARLNAVQDNMRRYATRTEKVAGSDTASNFAKREGFDNLVAAERGNGIGNMIAGDAGQAAFQTALGAKLFAHLPVHHIPLLGPLVTQGTKAAGSALAKGTGALLGADSAEALAAKTAANRDAMEKLLLNPKRLADAMHAVDTADKAKQAINENLISKVKGVKQVGGLLGSIAGGQIAGNPSKKR
ncbi:glucosaminidase domain-containing protein [Paraburkholderia sediminicola]|uniref:glucosaminidase domain-containing protein n=1 Tax=Paraburkholderia sediminicola TaxID=458836 RepID=UPI0038BDDC48